jgi:SRSO17 transposase
LNLDADDIEMMAKELVNFHQCFHGAYGRIEHHRLGLAYLSGLMSNAEVKSVEPIALEFLDIKKKVENCHRSPGVFVGYCLYWLSDKGYGLLNGRLYMPKSEFSKEQEKRHAFNLVPEDLVFETKHQIALKLIDEVRTTGCFPAKWIGADSAFGSDIEFLDALPKERFYFAAIKSDTQVFTKKPKVGLPPYKGRGRRPTKPKILPGQPKPRSVAEIAKSDRVSWKPVVVAEGATGPIIAKVARIRVYLSRDGLPVGDQQWLFFRQWNKTVEGAMD